MTERLFPPRPRDAAGRWRPKHRANRDTYERSRVHRVADSPRTYGVCSACEPVAYAAHAAHRA